MGRPRGSKNKKPPQLEQNPAADKKDEVMTTEDKTISQVLEAPPTIHVAQEEKAALSDLQKKRIQDERLVRGTFVYRAKPGGRYRTMLRKYRRGVGSQGAQGFVKVDMTDGQTYTVPYWVAEWLNGEVEHSCADLKHDARNINLVEEERKPPERVPVFRFVIQEYV
jgi:hypothetical protein